MLTNPRWNGARTFSAQGKIAFACWCILPVLKKGIFQPFAVIWPNHQVAF